MALGLGCRQPPANERYTHALALGRRFGYRCSEADLLRGLGEAERLVGEYGQARKYHTEALTLARQLGDRPGEAEALWGQGTSARRHRYRRTGPSLEVLAEGA